jgi:putative NIF3 family GTP cyclohydrolase 1 type 2
MAATIKDVTHKLEQLAPKFYQEDYDNSGLITGNPNAPVTGVLVTLDCTEAVVDEALQQNCNLIVAHHPILFKGIKKTYRPELCRAYTDKSHSKQCGYLRHSHQLRQCTYWC